MQNDEHELIASQGHPGPHSYSLADLGLRAACLPSGLAAVFLGLDARYGRRVQRLAQEGDLPRVAIGRSLTFPVEGLAEFVRKNTTTAGGTRARGEDSAKGGEA
jgi:hypothetical protein